MRYTHQRQGFVLIFAIWVLGLLTMLALGAAAGVRGKMILVKKLDERSRMYYQLQSASDYTKSFIRRQMAQSNYNYTSVLKTALYNNPNGFERISFGEDYAKVIYTLYDHGSSIQYFGVVDEERKININLASVGVLQRLLERVLSIKSVEALRLAQSILDWRKWGESQSTGFFSDDYYANLHWPYPKKDSNYEVLDELLLIKGIDRATYEQIIPFITIYGNGQVNINTASAQVLYAVGLDDGVIEKILAVRRGIDTIEATEDDHIFTKTFDVAADVHSVIKLEPPEGRAIDDLNLQNVFSVNSYYFSYTIEGCLAGDRWKKKARAIFGLPENKILYWSEK